MKITVIYSTERKKLSTTYSLAQIAINKLKDDDEVYEFFLPRDMDHFCRGCYSCFEGHPERCGGYDKVKLIKEAMDKSELIIFATPVYVYHIPGQMKALLDHFGYSWMVHQLNESMFKKQALIISTAAGAGTRTTVKDIRNSLDFWGVGHVYKYTKSIWAAHWTEIEEKQQEEMKNHMDKICDKIRSNREKLKPRFKVRTMFYGCRLLQKKVGLNSVDVEYWRSKGWLDKVRPW